MLRLDDLFVVTNDHPLGIGALDGDKNIISSTYYTIDGKRVENLVKGVNIVRTEMKDGSVKMQKVIIK